MSMLQAGKRERVSAKKLITADSILIFFPRKIIAFPEPPATRLFIAHETEMGHMASHDWKKV